jgi:hypothetical protein
LLIRLSLPLAAIRSILQRYGCYTAGHWEGDTLVPDSISFVDSTWFGRGGYFHHENLHIIEKLTRKGDEILYKRGGRWIPLCWWNPWVMAPRALRLRKNKDAGLIPERAYCEVYETKDIDSRIRH